MSKYILHWFKSISFLFAILYGLVIPISNRVTDVKTNDIDFVIISLISIIGFSVSHIGLILEERKDKPT